MFYIERLDALVEARFDALGHQAAAAAGAEVVLDALFAEAVFLSGVSWLLNICSTRTAWREDGEGKAREKKRGAKERG